MKHSVFGCDVTAVVLVVSAFVGAQSSAVPQGAVPLEPTAAILGAFRTHDVVALGDNEGSEQGHAFRIALVRDQDSQQWSKISWWSLVTRDIRT